MDHDKKIKIFALNCSISKLVNEFFEELQPVFLFSNQISYCCKIT